MPRYRDVRAEGLVFLFAHDDDDPELLHIFARHLTTIDDALRVWFDSTVEDDWNETYERFEVKTKTHVLYWKWLTEGERILIITCFTREE
jgi:hypothetical protein